MAECRSRRRLELKGSSITLEQGTKIANIRLAEGDHEVDGRVERRDSRRADR